MIRLEMIDEHNEYQSFFQSLDAFKTELDFLLNDEVYEVEIKRGNREVINRRHNHKSKSGNVFDHD